MNVLRLFDTSQGEVEAEKNAKYLASVPSELKKMILQRTEKEVIGFLEENKNDYKNLQNYAYSFAVDLYRTANYISYFDENVSDYLQAAAKPIFNWLREYGLQIHFLVANDFVDFSRPLSFFSDFFAAAGLPYLSPCYFAYELMKKDGFEIGMFNLLYPKYKDEAMEVCKDLIKELSNENRSYFFLDPNEDNDDHFALSLSYQKRDGHLVSVKTSGPEDGKGSLIYSNSPRNKIDGKLTKSIKEYESGEMDNIAESKLLDVIKEFYYDDSVVYTLDNQGKMCVYIDGDKKLYMFFSSKEKAVDFSEGKYKVIETTVSDILREVIVNILSGVIVDAKWFIVTQKICSKIYGSMDDYRTDITDWGEGIPSYSESQLMNKNMILDFGIRIVGDYLRNNGYTILHGTNKAYSIINIIAVKDARISVIKVDADIAPVMPIINQARKEDILKEAFKLNAGAFYAPVSFGSTDPKRFNESIALQGDSYYAKFLGLEKIESKYS